MQRCNHLIDQRHHGFLADKSCTTQLVSFCDNLALSLNDRIRTDVVYFDIQKAFGAVRMTFLISLSTNMASMHLSVLFQFFKIYLKYRRQRVVIGNKMSASCRVRSGVPQGFILGPTLFILFINGIVGSLHPVMISLCMPMALRYGRGSITKMIIEFCRGISKACSIGKL